MNKLSIKLGVLFFLIIFGLETIMFFFLHTTIVDSRVEEELIALQARGNSHRAVLEKHFDPNTISHVSLMESEASTNVIIVDKQGHVLDSSDKIELFQNYLHEIPVSIPRKGKIIADNWKDEPYIATISPIELKGEIAGYVYMFQDTYSVHTLISRLNEHFLLAGFIAVFLTIVIIIFLSKALTKPLIKMKDATSQMSRGNFSVTVPKSTNDELGDLARSIQLLANDLNYLKEERNEFLASISHELRTPLTYIKGYADIILKRNLTNDDQEKYLHIILEETNRMSTLIKDLFELAKIDKNTFEIKKININLEDLLSSVVKKLSPAFKQKQMSLEISCPSDVFVWADPSRLEQIILNLLDNSMKYSSTGDTTSVIVEKNKHSIKMTIKDNGKGIPPEDIPYLFNRFYRVDKARTRSLGGTGLGLAIVKELIDKHDWDISVKSKLTVGSEFCITIKE